MMIVPWLLFISINTEVLSSWKCRHISISNNMVKQFQGVHDGKDGYLEVFKTRNKVSRNPELVIRAALQEVTKKREMRYGDIKKIGKGIRRHFHDESTVVVIYLDQHRGFIIVEMPPYFYFE
ncbi:hypothetical protein V6N12_030718 [Hibiscus sabdariffa]|uniref:Uncharacterized protein n=1 Tax=Hibiscus sabdariffa TaxID=183260 RepID=A0ABR2E6S2_9ROSI